ncbi:PREDICTED: apolipoprotein B receptor [Elephantulus edwardii]|uniref:apolipoprotein B receptor n=1 Tax=Elephantulus edwardii TaxID=28737 RepID=UPI0003F06BD0|nr:PREDICTED: apolipoprotein B receptor [Elephantulus edwardii]
MDFLRQHFPGLHQALRGALDSFSTFVSYLIGDGVPTAQRGASHAAEELGEVGAGRLRRAVEEEAQEALEGLGGSQNEECEGLRGPGAAGRRQEEISAAEQTRGWEEGSSHGSQADKQDKGTCKAVQDTRCQEPKAPLETWKKPEAGAAVGRDKSSEAQDKQEPGEQEVNRGETLRTWEQEEEEEVRAREPGVAEGVESEWTWHKESEGKAVVGWQTVAEDGRETQQANEEIGEETQRPEVGKEEEVMIMVRGDHALEELGVQGPRAEHGVWPASSREETQTASGGAKAWTTSVREQADHPVVRETDYETVLEGGTPEGTENVRVQDEASEEDYVMEVDEKTEAEDSLSPKHTQDSGSKREEGAEAPGAGREARGAWESEEEEVEEFEGQEGQGRTEAEGRQDSEVRVPQVRLEETTQKEEEKGTGWATEARLLQDEETKGAEGDANLEATLEARSEVFTGQRSEDEAQTGWSGCRAEEEGLGRKIGQSEEPELKEVAQFLAENTDDSHRTEEELGKFPEMGKEETERNLVEDARSLDCGQAAVRVSEADAWGAQRRRDVERGGSLEKVDDAEEEAAGGAEAERGGEAELQGQWETTPDAECGAVAEEDPLEAENREPGGGCEAETGTGQSLEKSEAKDEKVKSATPWWEHRLEVLNFQERQDVPTSSCVAPERLGDTADLDVKEAAVEAGPEREVGGSWEREFQRGWDSGEREEAEGGRELSEAQHVEATEGEDRSGQEFSLEASAEDEENGRRHQAEALEAKGESERDQAQIGECSVADKILRMDCFISGSLVARTEGTVAMGEAEGLLGKQAVEGKVEEWQMVEDLEDGEQRGDHNLMGKARRTLDVEGFEVAGGQRLENKEVREDEEVGEAREAEAASEAEETGEMENKETVAWEAEKPEEAKEKEAEKAEEAWGAGSTEEADMEGLKDINGQKEQPTTPDHPKAEPELPMEAEASETAESAPGDAPSSWSEAPLPGLRLDVSISRSRALLFRNSSQRRSRPSSLRIPALELHMEPPSPPLSPPPEAELSNSQQTPLQPEETPEEPSLPRPEGTPIPARRRPLGHGFGLAHPNMMQELQARLGKPKPQ